MNLDGQVRFYLPVLSAALVMIATAPTSQGYVYGPRFDVAGGFSLGINGSHEVPPNSSTATGAQLPGHTLHMRNSITGGFLWLPFGWGESYGGVNLEGELLEVSLWAGGSGEAGVKLAVLPVNLARPDGRSGNVNTVVNVGHMFDPLGFAEIVEEYSKNRLYINIFTSDPQNPSYATDGEIRGHIFTTNVPEPATMSLAAAAALAGLAGWRVRARKRSAE